MKYVYKVRGMALVNLKHEADLRKTDGSWRDRQLLNFPSQAYQQLYLHLTTHASSQRRHAVRTHPSSHSIRNSSNTSSPQQSRALNLPWPQCPEKATHPTGSGFEQPAYSHCLNFTTHSNTGPKRERRQSGSAERARHMLPLHVSSAAPEKMNRHAYSGGVLNGGSKSRPYSIATDKYDK